MATALQRIWRATGLAALLMVSGCKDLLPSYMGGDVGAAAYHASQCSLQAQVWCASGYSRRPADPAIGPPGVSSTHAIVAANASKQGTQTHS
jgi:hypothetical protein